ncbi:hypothetical protein [Kineosporia sp. NBRC 101731]|uniref:hypothetical protein n=1 Tax=Kineosporia sp. NBRC 101731 TaxID=3032199 RepID=UPI00249FE6ED|nr:hypothetical protein [Kineosporia sp. NBRC 101731]GLY32138.1 hypothetical protein Kisp02_55030 [Kineosporia sp. NBRC 101731]
MTAILQIVDGLGGPLVLDLNRAVGGEGGYARAGMDLTEGEVATDDQPNWSPLAGPASLARRKISIPVLLQAPTADALGVRVAKLMQATRRTWWLRVRRHEGSADSWLRCFPCVPRIESQITTSARPDLARGVIECETDPYAYGARVDRTPAPVDQHPGASHDAWGIDISGVQGDTETPLLVRMHDSDGFASAFGAFVSTRRRQDPSQVVSSKLVREAESGANLRSGTAGQLTWQTLTGDDALSSNGGVRLAFADGYDAGRSASITFAAPTLDGPDTAGTYRMFLRIRRLGDAVDQQLVIRAFTNNSSLAPDEITVPAGGTRIRMIDLGLVQWPSAQPAAIEAPIPSSSSASTTPVTLQLWRRSSGRADIDLDYLCWIPADEDAGYLELDASLFNPDDQYVNIDGFQHQAMITSSNPIGDHKILGQAYGSSTPTARFIGGAPMVRPGSNRLFVVCGLSGVAGWPRSRTLNVGYSYWPRYTWLR